MCARTRGGDLATRVVFNAQDTGGEPLAIRVVQGPNEVFTAWTRAGDRPFALEREGGGGVYINPATVAYWEEAGGDQA